MGEFQAKKSTSDEKHTDDSCAIIIHCCSPQLKASDLVFIYLYFFSVDDFILLLILICEACVQPLHV